MNSLLPDAQIIQQLFQAYNQATGFGVPFNMAWERQLYDAAQMGLTPEMLALVLKERLKGVRSGDRKLASLMPRNLFFSEDIINEVLCEGAALMALKRKTVDLGKASVLASTGRPSDFQGVSGQHEGKTPETMRPARDVLDKALCELRKAI